MDIFLFQNFYGYLRSWNSHLSRTNSPISSLDRGVMWNPEVSDFNRYITIQPVTYTFSSHSLSHSLPDTNTVRERQFWGDSAIWSRISRIEGRLLVITIQRFRIHPPESISNPSHHEQRKFKWGKVCFEVWFKYAKNGTWLELLDTWML